MFLRRIPTHQFRACEPPTQLLPLTAMLGKRTIPRQGDCRSLKEMLPCPNPTGMPRRIPPRFFTVRHQDKVAIGGDGQVTYNNTILKGDTRKIRWMLDKSVLVGFRRLHGGCVRPHGTL